MPANAPQELQQAIAARLKFYRDLGIDEFYYRETPQSLEPLRIAESSAKENPAPVASGPSHPALQDRAEAMRIIQDDIGPDCTRCRLGTLGRKQVVFGTGNLHPDIMFVGEAPGADEDQQGLPFVGRAGQLLNNMIAAMGLRRQDVYIANICKCRPPNNRTPESDECATCSPFLMRQIEVLKPKIIVALGAVAAKTLLNTKESMARLRGSFYDFQGTKLAVTYHPAFLLRDPRQKKEAWKDLQLVMKYVGLPIPSKPESSS
jgi:uracil-DNA glycosylase family 4